jgi:hypothetical protein
MSTKKVPEEINIAVKQLNDKIEEAGDLESAILVARGDYVTRATHAKPMTMMAFICHMVEDIAAATDTPVDTVLKFISGMLDEAAEEEKK